MERSMTQKEFQEETLMMSLRRRGTIKMGTREEALKHLAELEAKNEEKK